MSSVRGGMRPTLGGVATAAPTRPSGQAGSAYAFPMILLLVGGIATYWILTGHAGARREESSGSATSSVASPPDKSLATPPATSPTVDETLAAQKFFDDYFATPRTREAIDGFWTFAAPAVYYNDRNVRNADELWTDHFLRGFQALFLQAARSVRAECSAWWYIQIRSMCPSWQTGRMHASSKWSRLTLSQKVKLRRTLSNLLTNGAPESGSGLLIVVNRPPCVHRQSKPSSSLVMLCLHAGAHLDPRWFAATSGRDVLAPSNDANRLLNAHSCATSCEGSHQKAPRDWQPARTPQSGWLQIMCPAPRRAGHRRERSMVGVRVVIHSEWVGSRPICEPCRTAIRQMTHHEVV